MADASDDREPLLDGRYALLRCLGRGGVGVVYEARHLEMERPVAVKLLGGSARASSESFARFRQEARTAGSLKHPHVVTVHDFGRAPTGEPFLVMEYCEGGSLADRLRARGRLGAGELAALLEGIGSAVDAAHRAGLVHRDLKPANILFSGGLAKVADFGLATVFERAGEGEVVGTPHYMSPEQWQGLPVDPRSDVYSLGVIAYEALSGELPFTGPNLGAVVEAQRSGPRPLAGEVPDGVRRAVARALAADVRERFATAGAFVEALRQAGEGHVAAPGPTAPAAARLVEWDVTDPVRPWAGGAPPIGREQDLVHLLRLLASTHAGQGRLVTVAGEPGRGKTTLVNALLERVAREERTAAIAMGRCSEQFGAGDAYLPLLGALESLAAGPHAARVRPVLRERAPTWVLQLANAEWAGTISALQGAARSLDRMPRELLDALGALCAQGPLLLVLEDLHWADHASVELLLSLAPRLASLRLLVLGTYRPEDVDIARHPLRRALRACARLGVWTEICPAPFDERDVARYLERECGRPPAPELVAFVLRRSEGNPLFVANVVGHLVAGGVLGPQAAFDGAALARLEEVVPEGLGGLIKEKLDRLADEERRLLQAASVEGAVFTAAVAASLLGRPEAEVEDSLQRLHEVHQLVDPTGEFEFPAGVVSSLHAFRHSLYQNALYAALPGRRREEWHLQAARRLRELYGPQPAPVLVPLIGHCEKGRAFAEAVEHCLAAAAWAARVDPREVAAHLERGLGLAERVAEPARAECRARLLVRLARHHAEGAELVGDVTLYDRAEAEAAEALRLQPGCAEARTVLGLVHVERGRNERACEQFLEALARAPRHAPAWDGLSYLFKNTGLWDDALATAARAAACDPAYAHSIRRVSVLLYQDRLEEARAETEALVRARPRFGHYSYWRGIVEYYAGELAAARRFIEQGYELDPDDIIAQGVLAFARALEGRAEEARALLAGAEPGAAADGTFTYWIGKAYAALGDRAAAVACVRRAQALGYWNAPWVRKDRALLSLHGHEPFEQALADMEARHQAFRSFVAGHDWRSVPFVDSPPAGR